MELDRLSNLPDELLIYILFHMEIKDAIRTSVLSKQWSRLWTQLPSLDINADSFDNLESFIYFLRDLIVHYDVSHLFSCKFVCNRDDMEYRVLKAVIIYVSLNKVKRLWIHCPRLIHSPPPELLANQYLEFLSLEGLSFEFPRPFYSTSIRSICLDRVFIDYDILMYCPHLENFSMTDCNVHDLSKIFISAPELEKLDLQIERLGDEHPEEMVIFISTPNIESLCLHFNSDSCLNLTIEECPYLEYAWIDVYEDSVIEKTEDVFRRRTYAIHLVKFLKGLGDVRSLDISAGSMKVLCEFPDLVKDVPSPFHNLNSLEIFTDMRNQPAVIPPEVESFLVGTQGAQMVIKN